MAEQSGDRIDLDRPRWDQSTFWGRAKHFFSVVDPLAVFTTTSRLEEAKELVDLYRQGKEPEGTSKEDVWEAKKLYESAYHPDSGELNFVVGRMSFQVFGNMTVCGGMMAYNTTAPAIFFWQFINQSFNAVVNYTNRNATAPATDTQLVQAYAGATGGALLTAFGLNEVVRRSPRLAASIAGKFVPFSAVAAANCINIPLMRQRELALGIDVEDEYGNVLCKSRAAAKSAITQVTISRVIMAMPGMVIPPIVVSQLENRTTFLKRFPGANLPLNVGLCGLSLIFATPLACAIFPQRSSIAVDDVEDEVRAELLEKYPGLKEVYFNKGL